MEQVLQAFGIDWRLIAIQIFNFTLLMGILWYFLYAPVLKLINERKEKIQKGVEDAEAAAKLREEAGTERKTILTKAHEDAEGIVENATGSAAKKSEQIVHEAEEKAGHILKEAKVKSEEAKLAATRESEADIAKLAVLAAEKVLRERS